MVMTVRPKASATPKQTDADLRKTGGDNRTAAACEGKPKRPDRLGGAFAHLVPIHGLVLRYGLGVSLCM
jgi:hypothetical protein